MKIASDWKDYELLEMKNGMKKERWGIYTLVRPDPQIIWTDDSKFNNLEISELNTLGKKYVKKLSRCNNESKIK